MAAQLQVVAVQHLSPEELGAYLSNSLSDADRAPIERHLVACDECRSELIEGQRAIASASSAKPARRSGIYAIGLAAAAVIAFAFWPRADVTRDQATIERNTNPSDAATVTIVSPGPSAEIANDSAAFVWRHNDGSSYKVTVTDAAGHPLWSETTADTTAVLPSSISLSRGQQFFWYVDALKSDGSSVTSGVNSFRTAR
jgi:hypothetical protein